MNMIKLTETDHIETKTVYVNTELVMTMHVDGENTVLTMNNGYETKVTESIEDIFKLENGDVEQIKNRMDDLSTTFDKLKKEKTNVERLADAMIQNMGGHNSDETKAFIESLNENEQAFNEMAGDPLTTLDNLKVKR